MIIAARVLLFILLIVVWFFVGAKIFFALNPHDYDAPELRDFFISRGANVERERIFFENGPRF